MLSGLRSEARRVNMQQCEYKNCIIDFIDNSYHHGQLFPFADAIIFQGGHMPPKPPVRANRNQTYVFATIESPQHLALSVGTARWNNAINWTMTYRTDSDIKYSYGDVIKARRNITKEKDFAMIFSKKTKDVAWIVSDCNTESQREKYVSILRKYINVDVYGKCGHFKNCSTEVANDCEETIAQDYKFYLSFENSMCTDYMTEKVYRWFDRDIVSVVRGSRTYQNLLPKGTYIDTSNFQSISALGKYLKELSGNEKHYVNMLREKARHVTVSAASIQQDAYCDICKRLQQPHLYPKQYPSIKDWWYQETCIKPQDINEY